MASPFLKDNETESDPIFPLGKIKVVMKGTSAELTNWILECADKNDDLENDDNWVQCSMNGYDWSVPGGAAEEFETSSGYAYRLRRTSGDAGATATWGHIYNVVWR